MSLNTLKYELVYLLRNADIFTTTARGVTTVGDTGTFAADSSHLIARTNVKNLRSVVVGTTTLVYGKDYTIDLDYLDTTIKCKITFTTAQTGDYTITYDYGTDKIWTDYPRDDLSLSSYPRISIEEVSKSTSAFSLGGADFISSRLITIVIYSENQDFLEGKLDILEALIRTNAKLMYYANFLRPNGRGPIIKHEGGHQTLLHKNLDLMAQFEVENA